MNKDKKKSPPPAVRLSSRAPSKIKTTGPEFEALRRAENERKWASLNDLNDWINSKNEEFLLALVRSPLKFDMHGGRTRFGPGGLLSRAIKEAEENNEIWTPLLDAIAASGEWDRLSLDMNQMRDEDLEIHKHIMLVDYLEQNLAPWAKQQLPPAIKSFISNSECLEARSTVVSNMPHPTVSFTKDLLDIDDSVILGLANRRDLEEGHHSLILQKILDIATNPTQEASAEAKAATHSNVLYSKIWGGCSSLAEQDITFSKTQASELLQFASENSSSKELDSLQRKFLEDLLLLYACVSRDQEFGFPLVSYYVSKRDSNSVKALLDKRMPFPTNTPFEIEEDLALHILSGSAFLMGIEEAVAAKERFREMPKVRRLLLDSNNEAVILNLAQDGREEEFRSLVLGLIEENRRFIEFKKKQQGGDMAAKIKMSNFRTQNNLHTLLSEHIEVAARTLEPEDLEVLLKSTERNIRTSAIDLMGRIHEHKAALSSPTRPDRFQSRS